MIFYLCPDYDVPSWGIGMIYHHVFFLNKNNIEACILHRKKGFKLSWLSLDVPIKYLNKDTKPISSDVLIVPEVMVDDKEIFSLNCRKLLFVQNAFILFERLRNINLVNELGLEGILYYMPHLEKVLSKSFNLPLYHTPAFVAEYYFKDEALLHNRKKSIIIYPKFQSRDYTIAENLLKSKFNFNNENFIKKLFGGKKVVSDWNIQVIQNCTHKQVAELMQDAAFFININTHEAFNSSVPEAMAAGCINFCYDAFGPADFVTHKENAFVYNNNHVFDLISDLTYYTDQYNDPSVTAELISIRKKAYDTALTYTMELAEKAIVLAVQKLMAKR